MDWILDLDLDFFVWPVKRDRPIRKRLPRSHWTHLATPEDVRRFLAERCHLVRVGSIPGRRITEHEEAFKTWHEWLSAGKLSSPFGVVHVDGHSDLGAGANLSFHYLDQLLALPLEGRHDPHFGPKALNSGNYLLGVIANRWLAHLKYVYPIQPGEQRNPFPPGDLPDQVFVEGDWRTGRIQLKGHRLGDSVFTKRTPAVVEPCIDFDLVPSNAFEFSGFTHVTVAHSPQYTPQRADELLSIVAEYFDAA